METQTCRPETIAAEPADAVPANQMDEPGLAFRLSRQEFAVSAYLAMNRGLDLQRWFEDQLRHPDRVAT